MNVKFELSESSVPPAQPMPLQRFSLIMKPVKKLALLSGSQPIFATELHTPFHIKIISQYAIHTVLCGYGGQQPMIRHHEVSLKTPSFMHEFNKNKKPLKSHNKRYKSLYNR